MNWAGYVDGYCERLAPGLWAEPVNLLTNIGFIAVALVMWRRTQGIGRGLSAVLFAIGLGSGLFHGLAVNWAALADVLPILGFILAYVFAASRDFLRLGRRASLAMAAAFLPYSAALVPVFARLDWLGSSAGYAPVPVLIAGYAVVLRRRSPATAGRLAIGAGLLVLSLALRTLDMPLCPVWPVGTHFLWHLLNAVMLGWMIETHRRHMLASGAERR